MINEDVNRLISRALSGESNSNEKEALRKWLESSDINTRAYRELSQLWQETRIKEYYSNQDKVFDKILEGMNNPQKESHHNIKGQRRINFRKLMAIAAAIALIAVGFFWFAQYQSGSPEVENQIPDKVVKSNPSGQKSKIFLPDGSNVWLNAESTLSYLPNFTDSDRLISLKGEAYFEVAKDLDRPFRVHCDGLTITALGTAFNVSVYQDEQYPVIALVEGKVKVNSFSESVVLNPGELCILDRDNYKLDKAKADLNNLISWKDGTLVFDGESIEKTMSKLERWFGVDITVVGNDHRNPKYYGTFKNESLKNILESMRFGRQFNYTIKGKDVIINFN